jgi:hypothetical protein
MGKSHSAAAGWKVRAIRFAGWDGFSHFESFLVLLGDSIFIVIFSNLNVFLEGGLFGDRSLGHDRSPVT